MFTDEFLRSLEPKDHKYDVREGTRKGFTVSVHPSGEISFVFFYFYKGRKRRMTLGRYPYISIKNAREIHKEALHILEKGHDPALVRRYGIIDSSAHKRLIQKL